MSQYVVLHTWAGDDADKAAFRLATMFALPQEEAGEVIRQIQAGTPWQFPQAFDEKNAETVNNYLSKQGFSVELVLTEAASPSEEVEEDLEFDDEDLSDDFEDEPLVELDEPEATPSPATPTKTLKGGSAVTLNVDFRGSGKELFKIMFINWILSIFTAGIYSFWGKTKVRRYIWEHSSFNRDFFHYHGTGKELFIGFVIFISVLGGLSIGIEYAALNQEPMTQQIIQSSFGLIFLLILPALMVGAYRYRFSRTSLRNIRFGFVGTRLRATFIIIVGYLLTLLTLGFYLPFYIIGLKKFWVENSRFGNKKFEYSGRGRDLMRPYLITILIIIAIPAITLWMVGSAVSEGQTINTLMRDYGWINILMPFLYIIGYFWWAAYLARYHWGHTHFERGTFKFTASGWDLFYLKFTNLILIIVTLGFGFPWAVIRERNYFAHYLSCEGAIDMNRIVQEIQQSGAISEGGADVFDIPIDFG